ncbi:hypothetical protein LJC33_04225 [Eubacteriales bacterium OttesenSCG-928-N13]|nr:hypothetical protein [Eubacteriales bacterium OttesenSCG-928-N13]
MRQFIQSVLSRINDIKIRNKLLIVYVIVRDNGIGMTPETLQMVRTSMKSGEPGPGKSVALQNVYRRLHYYYEAGVGLRIFSEQGKGTTIVIKIISATPK